MNDTETPCTGCDFAAWDTDIMCADCRKAEEENND